jgi:urease accessory protein
MPENLMHRIVAAAVLLAFAAEPALAHHVMEGRLPATFTQGLLSGLGHPIIGLDHFAAVVAVGCLAGMHRAGPALALAFVVAMMAGAGLHLQGASLPGAELIVALSVLLLGGVLLRATPLRVSAALVVFVLVGALHGYALGESIYGAERTPLTAYLIGLAVIQSAIALGALFVARIVIARKDALALRFAGAAIGGIGFAILMQQLVPAP